VHEAGHVVAAVVLGVDVEGASITQGADDDARVLLGPLPHPAAFYLANPLALREEMEKRVLVLMAGWAAVSVLTGEYRRSSFGCERDFEQAEELAKRLYEPESVISCLNRSRQQVRGLLLSRWREVESVCDYLLEHESAVRETLVDLVSKRV